MIWIALTIVGIFLVMYTYNLFQRHLEDANIVPAMISLFAFSLGSTGLIMSIIGLAKVMWFA